MQFLEHMIENVSFGPAVHARVNRVPVTKMLGQYAPLAHMLGNIEDRLDYLKITQTDVATLPGQAVRNGANCSGEISPCCRLSRAISVIAVSVTTPCLISSQQVNLPQYLTPHAPGFELSGGLHESARCCE